ncbi:MAG: NAD-dependent epimerase/dehydratase family protein [Nitrospinales bacterium]
MKKLLLTGATGFIGRHCLDLLLTEEIFEIHAVSSKKPKSDWLDVHWHQTNLLDSTQVAKLLAQVRPSHLLHFAWHTDPGTCYTSTENIRWVEASLALLRAFSLYGGQRIVVAGTCAEYDWKYGFCTENVTPVLPTTLYGICKNSLQVILSALSKQTGLSSAWGRIFFVYGPHDYPSKLVPSVIRSLLQGKPALCSHGNQIRDYLYVQDVADALVEILKSDVQGPVNIASGIPVSLKEIIYKVAEKLDGKNLIRLGALPVSPDEPNLLVGNVGRLSNELGWRPKYDLDNGLGKTIIDLRNQLNEEEAY